MATLDELVDLWRGLVGRLPRFVEAEFPRLIEQHGSARVQAVIRKVARAGHRRTPDRLRLLYGLLGEHLPADVEE
ncbi:hypothetical protein LILAB_18250 [Corallococcus macrosporus]|uniref:Uncharacterized protein n=1 Tax=Myxococcus fulvus (strain ATCC BAA-855 / HW-1) TaxID=483219 RepID=F8CRK7_MYXFH|nr:hypothetical protein LILAB_18250 [Corallococcus macrosporus]